MNQEQKIARLRLVADGLRRIQEFESARYLDEYAATLKAAQGGVTEAMVFASLLHEAKRLRDEFAGLPHSLGYEYTHLPSIDAAIAAAEAALSAEPAAQGDECRHSWVTDGLNPTRCCKCGRPAMEAATPAQPAERVPDIHVSAQGIRFGANCWYSHEYITGFEADRLNKGECNLPARQYMKWLHDHLAATPAAPADGDGRPSDCSGDPSSCPDNEGRGCYCSTTGAALRNASGKEVEP